MKSYSASIYEINRLIVSAFLASNNIVVVKNKFIRSLIIQEKDLASEQLKKFIEIQKLTSLEDLIELFEFVISPIDKKVTGAVYTPHFVRDYIVNKSIATVNTIDFKVCDPACGCSGFLLTVAQNLKEKFELSYSDIFSNYLFGTDIQEYSIERSKILLSLLAILNNEDQKKFTFNLYSGNALDFNWVEKIERFSGFDIVLGNPPYVSSRHITEENKIHLQKYEVCATGHPDLYIPFFQLGIEMLKSNGVLSFITMNTFFKSLNGRALRDYFYKKRYLIEIVDFGGIQIFDTKSTYTCICSISKRRSDTITYSKIENVSSFKNREISSAAVIRYESLDNNAGWNLQNVDILSQIQKQGKPLGKLYKSRNGIATLKNKLYIFNVSGEDENNYYFDKDKTYAIEKLICRDIINPNKLINIGSIDGITQKIIFPYQFNGNKVELIKEEIFKKDYPLAYEYLNSNRDLLGERDKGKGKYENWYAYGRNQSLERFKYKLFFPHISNKTPYYVLNDDEDLLFYNGLALISDNKRDLVFLSKLLSTRLFWFYILKSSRNYGSEYFSLSKNYFKDFGIFPFTEKEKSFIIDEEDKALIDAFVEEKYGINLG